MSMFYLNYAHHDVRGLSWTFFPSVNGSNYLSVGLSVYHKLIQNCCLILARNNTFENFLSN